MKKIPVVLTAILMVGVLATQAFMPAQAGSHPGAPLAIHVGWVMAYTQGVSITLQDQNGNTATYALDPSVRILPPPRAGDLAVGTRVTILARNDPSTGQFVVFGIVVLPPTSAASKAPPTPTMVPTDTPTLVPSETPTEMPTETPTNTPTDTPTNTPTNTPTETPTNTPTFTPTP